MSLRQAQKALWRAVRFDPTPQDALALFKGDDKLGAAERLAIYRNMYWYRQVAALADAFPRLREELGGERFTKLACDYIRKHPARHPALEYLGADLPDFIAGVECRMAGLARLEWESTAALIAADADAVATVADVAPGTFAGARLRFVPSLRLVDVERTWLTADEADVASPTAMATVAVWRKRFGVHQLPIGSLEAASIKRAVGGETMGAILAAFAEHATQGVAASDAATQQAAFEMIRGWFTRQWIAVVEV